MEVEMKAKITEEQACSLVDGKFEGYHISRGGGWQALYKSDTYYSFGGETLKKPTRLIRIRKESRIDDEFELLDIVRGLVQPSTDSTFILTIKKKYTDPHGIETNEEYESTFLGESIEPVIQLLDIVNFKPYFSKIKTSASFYVTRDKDGKEMHCEIVNVNGIGPYLEIETVVDGKSEVSEAKDLIKGFFKDVLDKKVFDSRSWKEIIEEGK